MHSRKSLVGKHTVIEFQECGLWYAEFDELLDRRLHATKATAVATQIEIEKGRVRDAEMFQQSPEMLHMPPAQGHDGDEGRIDQEIERIGQGRQDDPFRVAFDQ